MEASQCPPLYIGCCYEVGCDGQSGCRSAHGNIGICALHPQNCEQYGGCHLLESHYHIGEHQHAPTTKLLHVGASVEQVGTCRLETSFTRWKEVSKATKALEIGVEEARAALNLLKMDQQAKDHL